MAVTTQQQITKVLAPAKLWVMYGATATAPRLSYLHHVFLHSKSGSIGQPVDKVDLCIADDKGHILPAFEKGEIVARGSNLMQGYWKDEISTRQVLKNGFYHTGDFGYHDQGGFFSSLGV